MTIVTTLSFLGRTEEALTLYQEALGCEISFLMRFRDSPDSSFLTEGAEDLIFHATFKIDDTEFMASDVGHNDPQMHLNFEGFALALRPESIEEGRKMFEALAKDGQILIPLAESKFTGWYGIVKDKFGLSWKIVVPRDD